MTRKGYKQTEEHKRKTRQNGRHWKIDPEKIKNM